MDKREINEHYAEIARELIETEPALEYIRDSAATIVYLSSEHEKKGDGKKILGQCEKIQEKYKWSIPCDFTITLFEPNIEHLNDEQVKVVIFHELLHVGIKDNGDGTEEYSIRPHDLEDFRMIIERFGVDWADDDNEDFEFVKE